MKRMCFSFILALLCAAVAAQEQPTVAQQAPAPVAEEKVIVSQSDAPYMEYHYVRRKEPVVACLASAVIPGLGQVINGQYLKGLGFFVGTSVGYGVFMLGIIHLVGDRRDSIRNYRDYQIRGTLLATGGLALALGCHIASIIDATIYASRFNRKYGLSR
jgi:hypothetical protein